MIAVRLALTRIERRLVERVAQLEARLDAGDESAWSAYCDTAATLATIAPLVAPGAGGKLMTTGEMAHLMNISPKTLLRRRARGEVQAIQLGRRGRAALRWPAEATR